MLLIICAYKWKWGMAGYFLFRKIRGVCMGNLNVIPDNQIVFNCELILIGFTEYQ